jgi:hypothetical protein
MIQRIEQSTPVPQLYIIDEVLEVSKEDAPVDRHLVISFEPHPNGSEIDCDEPVHNWLRLVHSDGTSFTVLLPEGLDLRCEYLSDEELMATAPIYTEWWLGARDMWKNSDIPIPENTVETLMSIERAVFKEDGFRDNTAD